LPRDGFGGAPLDQIGKLIDQRQEEALLVGK
jgi:hypothetical protein